MISNDWTEILKLIGYDKEIGNKCLSIGIWLKTNSLRIGTNIEQHYSYYILIA